MPGRLPRHFPLACGLLLVLPLAGFFVYSDNLQQTANLHEKAAKLNEEKEQTLAQAKDSFSSEMMAASLAEIGDALSTAKATQAAAVALQTGDLAMASKELESLEWGALTPLEREIMGQMLREAAEKIKQRNLSQLSKATEYLADDLLRGTLEEISATAAELAEIFQTANLHQEPRRLLTGNQEHNADFSNATNGGQGTEKSKSPSQAWGSGDAENLQTGTAAQLDTIRQPQQLQGRQGEGPSEIETIFSNDAAEETSKRPYIDVSRASLQTVETSLETEPIPLRHRQMIRQYFR
jgi:hypothetical protein